MDKAITDLTEKEREALLLLLAGHDAKSSATELGLSVHTINDRLRNARRKLGVSSSREAARILGDAQETTPQISAREPLGVTQAVNGAAQHGAPANRRVHPLVWLAGGMLVLSLMIAAALYAGMSGPAAPEATMTQVHDTPTPVTDAADALSLDAARDWVALVDAGEYVESWNQAGALFRAQLTAEQWAATVSPVRQQVGALQSREFGSGTPTETLPGAPDGAYEVIQFQSRFADRPTAIETVVMMKEATGWKPVGYFIR